MSTHRASSEDWRQGYGSDHQPTLEYIGSQEGWYKPPRWSDLESFDSETPSDSRESVYIIHAPASGRVKIGRSKQVYKRFSALRTVSPESLELIAVLPDESEREMHLRFAHKRAHGEWFDDSVLDDLGLR